MITIYDIAARTGYSAPTVSKALNSTGYLTKTTREKILKTAEEMGYKPNMSARALTTKKTNLIGVIYDDAKMKSGFDHPLFGGVLNRFRNQIEAAGYDMIFLSKQFDMSYASHSEYRGVDGVVIINPDDDTSEELEAIRKAGIPCISTNNYIPGICTVLTENREAGKEGTNYLIKMGHRRIAFLGGPCSSFSPASRDRYRGYADALAEHGLDGGKELYEECDFWYTQAGYDGTKRLFARGNDFSAIFAANDLLAYGVMQYAEAKGIRIPEDISIIGFDDDRVSSFCRPRLTTFRQNRDLIADLAAETLLHLIVGVPAPDVIRIPADLIIRDSVRKII